VLLSEAPIHIRANHSVSLFVKEHHKYLTILASQLHWQPVGAFQPEGIFGAIGLGMVKTRIARHWTSNMQQVASRLLYDFMMH
jgi:hypothetical protein